MADLIQSLRFEIGRPDRTEHDGPNELTDLAPELRHVLMKIEQRGETNSSGYITASDQSDLPPTQPDSSGALP